MIKKLLLLIIPLLLFSCVNDDRRINEVKENKIDYNPSFSDLKITGLTPPPKWLKGKWDGQYEYMNLIVTNNDIILNGKSLKEKYGKDISVEKKENYYIISTKIKGKTGVYRQEIFRCVDWKTGNSIVEYNEYRVKEKQIGSEQVFIEVFKKNKGKRA